MMDKIVQAQTIPSVTTTGRPPAQLSELNVVFGNVITAILGFGAIVVFIMLVSAGFKKMTASGDPKKAAEAKSSLTYAFIGIVLLFLAFLILQLIAFFTGVDVTNFNIFQN